jgi:hypothetical protein
MKNILNSKFKKFFVHDTLKTDLNGFSLFDIYFEVNCIIIKVRF